MTVARRLTVIAVGAAQLAILAIGPLMDAPPAPAGHQQHLAADTDAGCHPYHDDHCVVCRVISTDAAGSPAPASNPLAGPIRRSPLTARPDHRIACDVPTMIRPRAPPMV